MRSFGFTLILALLAVLVCGVAGWQWKQGNFDSVFGAPPVAVGERVYSSFNPSEVKYILVSQDGVSASFELGAKGWQGMLPWKDRMDPRAAVEIITFTLGLRVEDQAGIDEIDAQKAGLKETGINIRLEGTNHVALAKYKLGRQTPWLATVEGMERPMPTVFIQPRDAGRKRHIYSCTGDIGSIFKDGLKLLRDHRPFYFNPLALRKIRILNGQAEPTLAREKPNSPWRLTNPLDLATDPKAVKTLLEGLYELRAVKVSDRDTATLATTGTLAKPGQIAITSFGSDTETVLDIYPPETPESTEVRATVSDRPGTVFELPLKPRPDSLSLADLPLSVNELRDAALTNMNNIQALHGVLIQPANGAEILVSRTPPQPWMTTIAGVSQEANKDRLFSLLQALTDGRATGFPTDAATDFTPWGLDKPLLKLHFLFGENQKIQLDFGTDGKGGYFVNRVGTPSVMRIDQALVSAIPVKEYEWRQSRVWSLDRNNLLSISRKTAAQPPLNLLYDFATGEWTANSSRKDLTANLVPERANFMLGILEGLKVTRWLSPDDDSAEKALQAPSLVFSIMENTTDDTGEVNGRATRWLVLAPGSTGANPTFYYGRLASDPQPFLLDRETYGKLATELLEQQ